MSKSVSKTSKKDSSKESEKKSTKASAKEASKKAAMPEEVTQPPVTDADELEEQEEAAEAAGHNSNAAAIAAAAGGTTEMSASFKNFRHHPDMENFYRFIYENDLRHEALAIIDEIMAEKQQRKLGKGAKSPH